MRHLRVLIVDDNPDHRFLIERALRGLADVALEIMTATDGEEAMEVLRGNGEGHRPHVMLLDLRMPRRSGLEVLAEVKQDPELRRIPVCVLTSSDRKDDIDEAYDHGTNAYVVKAQGVNGLQEALSGVSEFWGSLVALPEPP